MKRVLIDTNIVIRYLSNDHKRFSEIAAQLISASERGEVTLIFLPTVLAETIYVLESFYKRSRIYICETVSALLQSPGIEIADTQIHLNALQRYRDTKAHFIDCVIGAYAAAMNLPVATFDTYFRKFKDVRVDLN